MTDGSGFEQSLRGGPCCWGKWGDSDEIGALNYLDTDMVAQAVGAVSTGKVFTLQVAMCDPYGDPVSPSRTPATHEMVRDRSSYLDGSAASLDGGLESADDRISMWTHGTTHCDALGHAWLGSQIWIGYDAASTIGGLAKASILPIGEHGIVGRGLLLDIARFWGVDALPVGQEITHGDLLACAEAQRSPIQPRDILLVRTGWLADFMRQRNSSDQASAAEPGLSYTPQIVEWFAHMEVPCLVTDTTANELHRDPRTGAQYPLHAALLARLGVVFTELAWLDDLADDCAVDRQFSGLFVAAPLKIVAGTGGPVNPVVIK